MRHEDLHSSSDATLATPTFYLDPILSVPCGSAASNYQLSSQYIESGSAATFTPDNFYPETPVPDGLNGASWSSGFTSIHDASSPPITFDSLAPQFEQCMPSLFSSQFAADPSTEMLKVAEPDPVEPSRVDQSALWGTSY